MSETSSVLEEKNRELVNYLKTHGYIKSPEVEKAFLETPRHLFVPENMLRYAYVNEPLPIGYGQTISQPSVVALMTELLSPKKGEKILEIGTGSGWQAAILARIVGDEGIVYTIERVRELAKFAKKNLEKLGIKNVRIICGDGSEGLKEYAPFDKIIYTAAVPKIPQFILDQLKKYGKIVAPVGKEEVQKMVVIEKIGKKEVKTTEYPGFFVFVPLKGKYGFK